MTRRVAVRGIIVHDGKLLCVRHGAYGGKPRNEYWCLAGVGVDTGEPLIQAMERELVEELGIKPVVGSLLFVQQFSLDNIEQMELFFWIENATDYRIIDLQKTSHGTNEISEVTFINPATHNILPKFLTRIDTDMLSGDQPVKFFSYL